MQTRHFVSNAAVHATERPDPLRYETFVPCDVPYSVPLVPGPQFPTSVSVSNANGTVPTERRLRLANAIFLAPLVLLRRDPWPGQQQMQVKRASNERPWDTDQTSTRHQRYVNATSTERQPNINKASTEQQRVINPTINCRRESPLQRPDETRDAIRKGWVKRMSVSPSQRAAIIPHCALSRDGLRQISRRTIMRPRDDQQTDGVALRSHCTHPSALYLRTQR